MDEYLTLASSSLTPVAIVTFSTTDSSSFARFLAVVVLIAVNACFVAAEFSIVSVRRSRISQLAEAGDVQAIAVQDLQLSLERLLSTTQIGITLSSLALGWISEVIAADNLTVWIIQFLPNDLSSKTLAHSIAVPLTFFFIAYWQIVLGELVPKSLALLYSEQLARFLGVPSLAISRLFNPFIWLLNQSTRNLLKLLGSEYTGQGWYPQLTSEELQLIISTERESPELEDEERELLTNVLEFSEVVVGEVMVPRTSITAIDKNATFRVLLDLVAESGYSRYPVIEESLDQICGMIHFKELAEPLAKNELQPDTLILPWVRSAQFIPEHMPLSELLPLMKKTHQPMVVVVDEFGGTAGLVTIEDVVAEIIGDLPELESDEEAQFQMIDPQTYLVQAQMHLEEVNELLDLDLPLMDDYHTLGGFLLYQFQRIPEVGEVLQYNGVELTVVSAEGPRLHQIQVKQLIPEASSDDATGAEATTDVQPDAGSDSSLLDTDP